MSIPLDKLYHFLHDLVNHDIIIYRWEPHGSKKLSDLVYHKPLKRIIEDYYTLPIMICHDQEPLNYEYYTVNDFKSCLRNLDPSIQPLVDHPLGFESLYPKDFRALSWGNFYDRRLITHSELNSKQVLQYAQNNFIPIYFWSHGIIARDWFRYAQIDPILQKRNPRTTFLIYNRAWTGTREYRLKFAEKLVNEDLVSQSLTSFSEYDNGTHFSKYNFLNNEFSLKRVDIHEHFSKNLHPPEASADYCSNDYRTTEIEVVLETLFDDDRLYLTEKVLRPIACGHPFILVSTAGSLKYLKQYGFHTFGGFIDEQYDNISDHSERLNAIVAEMKRITKLPKSAQKQLWSDLRWIAKKNKERFFSPEFQDQILTEFLSNFNTALDQLKTSYAGNEFFSAYNFTKKFAAEHLATIFPKLPGGEDEYEWAIRTIQDFKSSTQDQSDGGGF